MGTKAAKKVEEAVRIAPAIKDPEVRSKLAKGVKDARKQTSSSHWDMKLGQAYKRWGAPGLAKRQGVEDQEVDTDKVLDEATVKLLEGSYEELVPRVHAALVEHSKRLFGSEKEINLLGTFKNYAIAVTEGVDAFRIRYETAQDGSLMPISAEPLNVKTYTPTEHALKTARSFVEAFLVGSRSTATEEFAKLCHQSAHIPPQANTKGLPEQLSEALNRDRPWKRLFTERAAQISEEAGEQNEKRLVEKFRRLHDGTIQESEWTNYDSLVTSDLKYLGGRLDHAVDSAETAVQSLAGMIPALKSKADPTVELFESFAQDYVEDAVEVRNLFVEATNSLNRVDVRAKLYDDFAKELHRLEVASCFVSRMSDSLAKVVTEDSRDA